MKQINTIPEEREVLTLRLGQRFVNEYNLPIQVIDTETFEHWLNKYEHDYNSLTLWNNTIGYIDKEFNGDVNVFLDNYYNVRNAVIESVKNNEAYQKFNNMDMKVFATQPLQYSNGKLYSEENVGKFFLSIDLKKANFQALKYVNPEIVGNAKTYDEFIRKYTNVPLITDSKYFRQVVFGQMNPSRHITVEKYLIHRIHDEFAQDLKLFSMAADELIYELPDDSNKWAMIAQRFEDGAKKLLDIEIRAEFFMLEGYRLSFVDRDKDALTFYRKWQPGSRRLYCVPLIYHAIVHSLM